MFTTTKTLNQSSSIDKILVTTPFLFEDGESAVKNLKSMFSLFDNSECSRERLYAAYENAFHPDVTARAFSSGDSVEDWFNNNFKEIAFDELFELFSKFATGSGTRIVSTSSSRIDGSIDFTVHATELFGHDITIEIHADTSDKGKIKFLEFKKTTFKIAQKIENLISLVNNTDRNAAVKSFWEACEFVDQNATARTSASISGGVNLTSELNLDEMFGRLLRMYASSNVSTEIVSIVPKTGGEFSCRLMVDNMGHKCLVTVNMDTNKGKVVRFEQRETIVIAIQHLQELLDLCDGKSEETDKEKLGLAYENLVDKDLHLLSFPLDTKDVSDPKTRVEYNFDSAFEELVLPASSRKIELVSSNLSAGGKLDFKVQMEVKDHLVTLGFVGRTKNGKFVRLTLDDIVLRPKISGQVKGNDAMPTLPEGIKLSDEVLPLPVKAARALAEGTAVEPCVKENRFVKVFVDQSRLQKKLFRTSPFEITTAFGEPYADGTKIIRHHRIVNRLAFELQDKNGSPLALCLADRHVKLNRGFTVYGRTPLNHSHGCIKYASTKLYPWFRMEHNEDHLTITVSRGTGKTKEVTPVYKLTRDGATRWIVSNVSGTFEEEQTALGVVERTTKNQSVGLDVAVAPGADPAVILCAAVVGQELL